MIFCFECSSIEDYKMNEIVSKFLLAGGKFMPEMHLKQPGFTYGARGAFTKFKVTGDSRYIYKNDLDKACFQHDITYEDFKDLSRRTISDKVLRNKAFSIAKNPKYDGYQRGQIQQIINFSIKCLKVVVLIMKLNKMNN